MKVSRDFFIEQQRFFQRRHAFSSYYSRPHFHDNAQRPRNLMQSLQSLLSFTQSLVKSRFFPVNCAKFAANFRESCEIQAVKARVRDKFSRFCQDPDFFEKYFLLACLHRKLSRKLANCGLLQSFAYLLRNGLQPAQIKADLRGILEKMLENNDKNQRIFDKTLEDFNFAPEFLDVELFGNVRFSTKNQESTSFCRNIGEEGVFVDCEWLSFNKKLSFRTILGSLLKMLRFFYVFRYIFLQIFENSGRTLHFRVNFQLQYDKTLIKPAVFREITREFAVSRVFTLELSFQRPNALKWCSSFGETRKSRKSVKNLLKLKEKR